jgi:hypothetical protein
LVALPYYPFWPAPQALVPGGTATNIPMPNCAPGAIPGAVPAVGAAAAAPAPAPANNARPTTFRPVGYDQYGYGYYAYPQPAPWWYGR